MKVIDSQVQSSCYLVLSRYPLCITTKASSSPKIIGFTPDFMPIPKERNPEEIERAFEIAFEDMQIATKKESYQFKPEFFHSGNLWSEHGLKKRLEFSPTIC